MSTRNLFIIKAKSIEKVQQIYGQLDEYMMSKTFSIAFEPKGYWDPILALLECNNFYFAITNNEHTMESEDLFSLEDSFDFAINFPKNQFKAKEYEFLYKKLSFLNNIVNIVFKDNNVETIEFYISDQYSTVLSDFDCIIEVVDGKLVEALIETFKPMRKYRYYGMKTTKFVIKR